MPAGTITLTNNSAIVRGAGTAFTSELKPGDFIVATVGGVTYTLPVKTVDNATQATLIRVYDGPTQAGAAWSAVPRETLNAITAQLAAESSRALRGLNYDKDNWQQVFSGTGNITVKLPDGSTFNGPAWNSFNTALNNKAAKGANSDITSLTGLTTAISVTQGGTGATTATASRVNLEASTNQLLTEGTGSNWYANFSSKIDFGMKSHSNTQNTVSPWDAPAQYTIVNYFPSTTNNIGTAIASNWGGSHDYYLNSRNSATPGYQGWKGWVSLWHSRNTTVDGNGFIKKASPIVRLCSSTSIMPESFLAGFVLSGSAAVNSEAVGVSAERISVGVYRIAGSLGLADDGWTIEIPQDVNGNRLCFVSTETDGDGTITVNVSQRKLDTKSPNIVAGEPMDIPAGRWIDLRLEMPKEQ
ncbi:phage tail protein [Serratia fonticola]|nr:phage tail protein [Serratia fonticola]